MVGKQFTLGGKIIYTILKKKNYDHPYNLRLEWVTENGAYCNEPYSIDSIREWLKKGEIKKIVEIW